MKEIIIHDEQGNKDVGYDFTEEIDRGVALLNEKVPGWFDSIDINHLQLEYDFSCVLGQLAISDLREQITALYPSRSWVGFDEALPVLDLNYAESIDYGFNLPMEWSIPHMWEKLTLQWVERIEKLRADAGTMTQEEAK